MGTAGGALAKTNDTLESNKSKEKVVEAGFGPYMTDLQAKTKARWYPPGQKSSKHSVVLFVVEKDGNLKNLKLMRSSGTTMTDISALKAVSEAGPFPSLLNGSPNNVDIQFTFDYSA